MILRVNSLPISTVVPPGYPGAMTGLHHRIERCGEATRRPTPPDGCVIPKQIRALWRQRRATARRCCGNLAMPTMTVGLTVGYQDEPSVAEK
jgi:hypothetical protein